MISDSIRIGYTDVPIQVEDLKDDDCFGYFVSYPKPRIAIHDQLTPLYTAATGLHEVIEAISAIYGLELTEGQIRTLETALVNVVRSNSKLCRNWLEMISDPDPDILT